MHGCVPNFVNSGAREQRGSGFDLVPVENWSTLLGNQQIVMERNSGGYFMKAERLSSGSCHPQCIGARRLLVLLAVTVILLPLNAVSQHQAVPKLTLAQVEELVSHHVPDATMSAQIQQRGLAFAPNPAVIESLRAKGAGPQTLAAIKASPSNTPSEGVRSGGTHLPGPSVKERTDAIWMGGQYGLGTERVFGGTAAVFSAANSSRLEYGPYMSSEGTLELWIKVNHGYRYDNFQFRDNQSEAVIFSSDCSGGDVTWPGTTKLSVNANGDITLWMATSKYNNPPAQATVARGTPFRFGQWHAIGISYGSEGQWIKLDGKVVAASLALKQTLGQAGNHQHPLDVPTIGETVSHFWDHHRYEGGFDGALAGIRVSSRQKDWSLTLGPPSN
jgi:hypothetical protein